jgi:hypothetical protein
LFISFQVDLLELGVKVAFFEFEDFMWLVETNDTWITIEPQEIDNTMSKVQQLVESFEEVQVAKDFAILKVQYAFLVKTNFFLMPHHCSNVVWAFFALFNQSATFKFQAM